VGERWRRNQSLFLLVLGVFVAGALGVLLGSMLRSTEGVVGHQSPSPTPVTSPSASATQAPESGPPATTGGEHESPPRATALDLSAAYDLDVALDYARGTAHVVERLAAKNVRDAPIDQLNLFVLPHLDAEGFRELELNTLEVDGNPVTTSWTMDGANLVVPLARRLEPGATAELVIDFDLAVGPGRAGGHQASLSKSGGVMSFLLWYPILSDGHDARLDGDTVSALPTATVTYRIRSASRLDMAVPGEVLVQTPHETTGRLEHARDFAFAVGPNLRRWVGKSGPTRVLVYAPRTADGERAAKLASRALDRFGRLLAEPYPAERLVVVGGSMDMESSGLVFLDAADLADEYKVAHEVAHEWFHWLVGNDQLREPWLDEAFATYLGGGLEPRHADGYCSALPVNSSAYRFPSVPLEVYWTDCNGYVQTVYYKGSWLLDHVRDVMGEQAFLDATREYIDAHRFGIATTRDLVETWRRHSPLITDADLAAWLDLGGVASPPDGDGATPA
jgi:hypothetical protein